MSDDPAVPEPAASRPRPQPKAKRLSLRRKAIGFGAAAAAFSALLGVLANLSEIAGLFSPDETRDLVQETRVAVQDTDTKVSELLVLLRNQAAAAGLDLLPVIIANRGEVAFESGDVQSACRLWSEAAPALAKMGSAHAVTVNQMANDTACPVVGGDQDER